MPYTSRKPPLVTRVPRGLREQPAWVFIGALVMFVGLSYVTGLTESQISKAIGYAGLKVWGAALSLSGALVIVATISAKPSLEKLALRLMSCTSIMYMGYLLTVVSVKRAAMTVALSLVLSGMAEFRIAHIKALIRHTEVTRKYLGRYM